MAKFYKAEDEVQDLVHQVAADLMLEQFMDFEALYVPKAKEVVTVSRASAIAEYLSNRDDLVLVIIFGDIFDITEQIAYLKETDLILDIEEVFGDIFDKYDSNAKYMAVRMAMEQIAFDTEKDKITIGCPMISLPMSFYDRYHEDAVKTAILGQLSIAQWEDEKKKEKEQKKQDKKRKEK